MSDISGLDISGVSGGQIFTGVPDELTNTSQSAINNAINIMNSSPAADSLPKCVDDVTLLYDIFNTNLTQLEHQQQNETGSILTQDLNNMRSSIETIIQDSSRKVIVNPMGIRKIIIFFNNNRIYGVTLVCYIQETDDANLPIGTSGNQEKTYSFQNMNVYTLNNRYQKEIHTCNNNDPTKLLKGIRFYKKRPVMSYLYDLIEIEYHDGTVIKFPPNFSKEELNEINYYIYKVPRTYDFRYKIANDPIKNLNRQEHFNELDTALSEQYNLNIVKVSELQNDPNVLNKIINIIQSRGNNNWAFYYFINDTNYQTITSAPFRNLFLDYKYSQYWPVPIPQFKRNKEWKYLFFLSPIFTYRYDRNPRYEPTFYNFPNEYVWSHWHGTHTILKTGTAQEFTIGMIGDQTKIVLPNFDLSEPSDFEFHNKPSYKQDVELIYDNTTSLQNALALYQENATTAQNNSVQTQSEIFTDLKTTISNVKNAIEEKIVTCDNIKTTEENALSVLEQELTNAQNTQGFHNMNENNSLINKIYSNILNNFEKMFTIKEGLDVGSTSASELATYLTTAEAVNRMTQARNTLHANQERGTEKLLGETLAKRDNLFSKVVYDYMINEREGSDIKKVYDDLYQKNINDMRQVEINKYYLSSYRKYINIIKFIILLCIILVPILILNQNYLIPLNVTMFLVITILIIGAIYIIYQFVDIYMRDGKNFDKIKIPYDRTTKKLQDDGKMKKKGNPFFGNITCIGDDCCDVSMVYDNLLNKCVLQENFNGYFEDCKSKEPSNTIVEPYIGMSDQQIANSIMLRSLNISSKSSLNNMDYVTQDWSNMQAT